VVINHPGANGSIAARVASSAAPDGYTLFMPALSTFVALLTVAENLPLKLPRDFLPIGFTADNPMFVAVNSSLGITTLPQLIALAKKEPGKISIAVTGIGRLTHLTGEMDGLTMDHVVSTTVFMKDVNEFEKMNAVYATYFKNAPPARATIEVARLPRDAKIEISAIAVAP
jgi:tripartite-type tricarboxylate transporter receptor subunit TctC